MATVCGVYPLAGGESCSICVASRGSLRYTCLMTSNLRKGRDPQPETIEFKGGATPKQVTMLHNGQTLPFEYDDGVLSISAAPEMQTKYADVIKVVL